MSRGLSGHLQSRTFWTLSGLVEMPSVETMCPRKATLDFENSVEGKASVADALENRCQVVQEVRVISAKHNNVILVDKAS